MQRCYVYKSLLRILCKQNCELAVAAEMYRHGDHFFVLFFSSDGRAEIFCSLFEFPKRQADVTPAKMTEQKS